MLFKPCANTISACSKNPIRIVDVCLFKIHQYDIVKAGQANDACKLPSPEKTDIIVVREPGVFRNEWKKLSGKTRKEN